MLNFHQATRLVRKGVADARSLAGNPGLSGDVLSVRDAEEVMRGLLADKLRQDPSTNVVQYVNGLARSQQWSAETGAAAARSLIAWAEKFGGGLAPGFGGASRGNIDKAAFRRTVRRDLGVEKRAYDELVEKAAVIRESAPHLSEAQAFEKALVINKDLAAREHRERMAAMGIRFDGGRVAENII